jgi:hypothetical protein
MTKEASMTRFTRLLGLLALVGSALGCATTTTAPTASATPAISDVKLLNGTWIGSQTGRSFGARQPLTIVISDGTYAASFGAGFSSTGTVTVTDGKITIVRTGGSGGGGSTLIAASTAVIEERNGRRVLVGQGRNDLGPFSYELTEQK